MEKHLKHAIDVVQWPPESDVNHYWRRSHPRTFCSMVVNNDGPTRWTPLGAKGTVVNCIICAARVLCGFER